MTFGYYKAEDITKVHTAEKSDPLLQRQIEICENLESLTTKTTI